MTELGKTERLVREHGGLGISWAVGRGLKHHVVHRRNGKTLCGQRPVSIFGVDLVSRRQVTCEWCYRLAFRGPNAAAPGTPDLRRNPHTNEWEAEA